MIHLATRRHHRLLLFVVGMLAVAMPALAQPGTHVAHPDAGVVPPWPELERPHVQADSPLPLRFDPQGQRPVIMMTGYWPPSNEALRRFSPNPEQNPAGWIGSNWEGSGYDVVSFFPEFVPPNCDNCGKGTGDLEVDYQDTSLDFWHIASEVKPIAIITFSRGSTNLSWEVEMNQYNRLVWINDYLPPLQPTPAPPDGSVPANTLRLSKLPVKEIVNAVNEANLGLNAFVCYSGDGGGFLSEFIAYHGVWYQAINASPASPDWCIVGGHIHVGGLVSWETARQAAEITLRQVIQRVDTVVGTTVVQEDIGYGGPGDARLAVAGDALVTGGTADLMLYDAPANTQVVFVGSRQFHPRHYLGGTIVPLPPTVLKRVMTDENGRYLRHEAIRGGHGPRTFYLQAVYDDPSQLLGKGISNAVRLEFLP